MTTRTTERKKKLECGYCHESIYEDEYRNHVLNCNKSDEEDEDQPVSKMCSLCRKQVKDLIQHHKMCPGRDDKKNHLYNNRQSSPTSSVQQQSKNNISSRATSKKCPMCLETVDADEFQEHVKTCDDQSSHRSTNRKKSNKRCPTCSETIDADDLADHIDRCNIRPSHKSTPQKNSKRCPTCSETIDADDFADHIDRCNPRSSHKPTLQKNSKRCPTCSETIDADDFVDHIDRCDPRPSHKSTPQKNSKRCPTCSETIDADDFVDHIDRCDPRPSHKVTVQKNSKRCPTCSQTIDTDDFSNHTRSCTNRSSREPTTTKTTQECPICFKEIPIADSQKHVNGCLEKTASRTAQLSCFTCSLPVDLSKNSGHTMPCRTKHIYCLKCLENAMNELIRSNTAPVCHSTLCTSELSRYDVECLPLQVDMITRLLALVKSTQRPQCPSCFFYVEFKTMTDLQRHVISCNFGDMMSCEYCHCLFNKHRLNDHSQQCRNDPPSQQRQALINFILPRTKYSLTQPQIQVFLEVRRKNHSSLDPRAIIDALAELEGAFPFDVPTLECDICKNSYVYEDIFVFGCKESHKICYDCFAASCKTKMNSNEVLTCAICAHQLLDGEIKELRVPSDEKRLFVEYQTQKTFGAYASGQGIIRCPNQKCKWVAEAQNPNERFRVDCPLCHQQFCSLCSAQYHFRTTCQEIPELTQRWFFWCNTERGNYWQARAQQDANFRTQLEDYERQKAANEQRNDELRKRYNDLLVDENYKAQNCRLCPHCGRVVQLLEGCNSMICGQNYHGGDVQSGCGKNFNWAKAARYIPIANAGPEQVANNMATPEQQKLVVHKGVRCDTCGNDVQGIRFDCVHCSSLTFCEKCEQRSTLEHANQIRNQNKPQHVFQLITTAVNAKNRQ